MSVQRGGQGGFTSVLKDGNVVTFFPPTDGRGCPNCGQIGGGGHGGNCPREDQYDENGEVIT